MKEMRAVKTLTTLLLTVCVAACDGELESPEYRLGREIIKTFAEYVGEDPSDIRVRFGATDLLRRVGAVGRPEYADLPNIAEAISKYVEEAGISFPALSDEGPPVVPRVISEFGPGGWMLAPLTIHFAYGGDRALHDGGLRSCSYGMEVRRLTNGKWHVGAPELLEPPAFRKLTVCPFGGRLP